MQGDEFDYGMGLKMAWLPLGLGLGVGVGLEHFLSVDPGIELPWG